MSQTTCLFAIYKSQKKTYICDCDLSIADLSAEWERIALGFEERWNFSNGTGAVDGEEESTVYQNEKIKESLFHYNEPAPIFSPRVALK